MNTKEIHVEKLLKALELLRANIRGEESRKELPLQMLLTFLTVASRDGITIPEAAKEMKVQQSTISRNCKDMGIYLVEDDTGKKTPMGCNLIYNTPSLHNRREHALFLTAKGSKLIKDLEQILL